MAQDGYLVRELAPNGEEINLFACASEDVARDLVAVLDPGDGLITYQLEPREFTDSEFRDTIGYWRSLSTRKRRHLSFVRFGTPVPTEEERIHARKFYRKP